MRPSLLVPLSFAVALCALAGCRRDEPYATGTTEPATPATMTAPAAPSTYTPPMDTMPPPATTIGMPASPSTMTTPASAATVPGAAE